MNFTKIFQLLIDYFNREEIDYALIGAFALKAYRYVRATQDVDFLVRRESQPRIVEYLESLGYETIHKSSGYSNHLHPHLKLGRIDIVYVAGDTAEAMFSETRPLLLLGDIQIPVVKPEHLVALKVFAMKNDPSRRLRELADIQYILSLPGIDLANVKSYFEKYGQMDSYEELIHEKNKKELDLESDINFTEDDLVSMRRLPDNSAHDIRGYLDFLEEMGTSGSKRVPTKYYGEIFEL